MGAGPGASRPGDYTLFVLKDGAPLLAVPVDQRRLQLRVPQAGPGRYRLQVQRGSAIEAVSSPIYLDPALAPYPRPGGATPLRVPLVPELSACTAPNSSHSPPLDAPSCTPPRTASSLVTISSVGRGAGSARLDVEAGDPSTAADEADVHIAASMTDVRNAVDGSDYAGQLALTTGLRITDGANGPSQDEPATVEDFELGVPLSCSPTADPLLGAACSVNTSADTLVPGMAREGDRAVISAFSLTVEDPGADGELLGPGCPPACGTGDEAVFLRQGLFLP